MGYRLTEKIMGQRSALLREENEIAVVEN